MRTRAQNEQAEAALKYRRGHRRWVARLAAKYGVTRTNMKALMGLGDRACLCGRCPIAGDGSCLLCDEDEEKMGRQYTEEELTAMRQRDWTEEL